MSPEELNKIANHWLAAFNVQHLDNLLSLYDEQAEHFSPKLKLHYPETKGLIKGRPALRTWWDDAFERLPSLQYEVVRLTPHDDRVFMEYIRHVEDEDDLYVGEMLQIKNGLIIKSSVFHQ